MPGDWFPGDTSIAGNECARITSAKSLRKPEGPWCVMHTFATAVLLQSPSASLSVDKMVPWTGKALHCFPLWWTALVGPLMWKCGWLKTGGLGSIFRLSLAWSHGSPGPFSSGTLQIYLAPGKHKEPPNCWGCQLLRPGHGIKERA